MKNLFLLAATITCFASSSLAFAETKKDTAITIYSTSIEGDSFALIVLRQAPRKINLITCSRAYKGTLTDSVAVRKFYEDAFKVIDGTVYCTDLDQKRYFTKRKIEGEENLLRFVYTSAKVVSIFTSEDGEGAGLTTYTIDANDDYGQDSSNDDIFVNSSFIIHTKLENPVLNTYRATYKLVGRTMTKLQEIK